MFELNGCDLVAIFGAFLSLISLLLFRLLRHCYLAVMAAVFHNGGLGKKAPLSKVLSRIHLSPRLPGTAAPKIRRRTLRPKAHFAVQDGIAIVGGELPHQLPLRKLPLSEETENRVSAFGSEICDDDDKNAHPRRT